MSRSAVLFIVLCLGGGFYQNRDRIARWYHPPVPGSEHVVLYATTWCGYCAQTREFLGQNNIAYQELDVENNDAGRRAYEKLNPTGVPIVVINNETVIRGYQPEAILAALRR